MRQYTVNVMQNQLAKNVRYQSIRRAGRGMPNLGLSLTPAAPHSRFPWACRPPCALLPGALNTTKERCPLISPEGLVFTDPRRRNEGPRLTGLETAFGWFRATFKLLPFSRPRNRKLIDDPRLGVIDFQTGWKCLPCGELSSYSLRMNFGRGPGTRSCR